MATISLSPRPVPFTAMSARRGPLANNPNVANSPLRGASVLSGLAKQRRSHATVQREEAYGQPPPVKKQALEDGGHRPVRSPTKIGRLQTQKVSPRGVTRLAPKDRSSKATTDATSTQDAEDERYTELWRKHHMSRFPNMVFYFDSIPDEVRLKLTKKVHSLGSRQEAFFSINVTHVVTTRSIPSDQPNTFVNDVGEQNKIDIEEEEQQQPRTINPSLLDRSAIARRKLFEFRNPAGPRQLGDDSIKRARGGRANDVLQKAREMGKKIWSLDKFQNILQVLLENEGQQSNAVGATAVRSHNVIPKPSHEQTLTQMLHNERIHGPSDRDPTAVNKDLNFFKGHYIYVWDMEERQKPIMVREYSKVSNKADGEWPQFRSARDGRCPFVEPMEAPERVKRTREQDKPGAEKGMEKRSAAQAPKVSNPPAVIGKRTLAEMQAGQSNVRDNASTITTNRLEASKGKEIDMPPQAFISRARAGRVFAGEPMASGLQASNVTSAIRSQMISSTSGIHGAKAGTSKEVHGLKRQVLDKGAAYSQDGASRRLQDLSTELTSGRSVISRQNSKSVTVQEEDTQQKAGGQVKKAVAQPMKSKKDLRPGYCENCQDKFRDFDEHILSRKHRKFADNDDNWAELDHLLGQLARLPRRSSRPHFYDDEDNGRNDGFIREES